MAWYDPTTWFSKNLPGPVDGEVYSAEEVCSELAGLGINMEAFAEAKRVSELEAALKAGDLSKPVTVLDKDVKLSVEIQTVVSAGAIIDVHVVGDKRRPWGLSDGVEKLRITKVSMTLDEILDYQLKARAMGGDGVNLPVVEVK